MCRNEHKALCNLFSPHTGLCQIAHLLGVMFRNRKCRCSTLIQRVSEYNITNRNDHSRSIRNAANVASSSAMALIAANCPASIGCTRTLSLNHGIVDVAATTRPRQLAHNAISPSLQSGPRTAERHTRQPIRTAAAATAAALAPCSIAMALVEARPTSIGPKTLPKLNAYHKQMPRPAQQVATNCRKLRRA